LEPVRVDAALVALAAAAASLLLLSLYARFKPAYAGAYDCYRRALEVAAEARARLDAGSTPNPPQGWQVLVIYANGTALQYGSLARERCRAYAVAGDGALIIARG
jgi:hypothetical protein